jgi:fibronectin type 3 domain-containing protein
MPFRAPVELVGASISDIFTTEILKTYKYQLVERGQIEQVLGEQALGLKGVTESVLAMKVGKILGVQGAIVGTVPEYGSKASGPAELASIGINVRMIDITDGSIVWSITDSAISDKPISLSSFARRMIENMVSRLRREWIRAGDTHAMNLPSPQILNSYGKLRRAVIEILPDSPQTIVEYKIFRSQSENGPYQEIETLENSRSKNIRFEDKNLLDAEIYYYKIVSISKTGMTGPPAGPIKIATAGPPGAVAGLSAESDLIRKVALNWQSATASVTKKRSRFSDDEDEESSSGAGDKNIKGYHIYRRSPGGSWLKIKTIESSHQSTYTDEGLGDEKTYHYRIMTFNIVGTESPPSQVAIATTKGPPSSIRNLTATSGHARKIPLSWSPSIEPEVKGYAIYRADKESGPFEILRVIEGREQIQYSDGGKRGDEASLKDDARYFYKIKSVNVVDVQGADSPVVSAITKAVPRPVTSLNASQIEVKQVTLNWKLNQETDIAKYEVFRGDDPGNVDRPVQDIPATLSHFTDKDLKDGMKYYYKVRAVDKDGLTGKFSEVISSSTKSVPKKPEGLKANIEGSQIRITWQPNPEKDIARYVIFKKGFLSWDKTGESTVTDFSYREELKKGKTFTFRLTAVDLSNLESEPSEEVSITIP